MAFSNSCRHEESLGAKMWKFSAAATVVMVALVSTARSSSSALYTDAKAQKISANQRPTFRHRVSNDSNNSRRIAILFSSNSIDKQLQQELMESVFIALRELDNGDLHPDLIDVSKTPTDVKFNSSYQTVSRWILTNRTRTVITLFSSHELREFLTHYDSMVRALPGSQIASLLTVFTPRIVDTMDFPQSAIIRSLQMSEMAMCIALLNRVQKVGVRTLIPVVDGHDSNQLELLRKFMLAGENRLQRIRLTRPILIDNDLHLQSFREILDEYTGFHEENLKKHDNLVRNDKKLSFVGVLMLATKGSQTAMQVAAEKRHMQIGWFSPNILEHEEWAYAYPTNRSSDVDSDDNLPTNLNNTNAETEKFRSTQNTTEKFNPHFGLYSLAYVGSYGWDNPSRRRVMRELTSYTGASPRILTAVLAYDSATLAVSNVRQKLSLPVMGLSGEIAFDSDGYRREGSFFGVSAVPDLAAPRVTLLQPSTWILDDTLTILETIEGQFLIQNYEVATSSILTADELLSLANHSRYDIGCSDHVMNLVTHDPFNQMPYNYFFKEESLPQSLLVPNQHGFGITFLCIHSPDAANAVDEPNNSDKQLLATKLRIACTPGMKISEPIKCFKTELSRRQRRDATENAEKTQPAPQDHYQYGLGSVQDIWNQPQNTKWSNPMDEKYNYYYQQQPQYQPSATQSPYYRKQDTAASVASSEMTTAAPAPVSKLPELRQILKAAKPFVGSCIGSTTGCAMCVLVLGRLPLGTLPGACTGPCFVGTFGSCGSLLGRVFSETTIICTELFRQGKIGTEAFVADAEFGRMMYQEFPTTLLGYQILASPLVELMKRSRVITEVVAFFAIPWGKHMMFLMGRSDSPSLGGLLIHNLGFPICYMTGQVHSFLEFATSSQPGVITISVLLLTLLTSQRVL